EIPKALQVSHLRPLCSQSLPSVGPHGTQDRTSLLFSLKLFEVSSRDKCFASRNSRRQSPMSLAEVCWCSGPGRLLSPGGCRAFGTSCIAGLRLGLAEESLLSPRACTGCRRRASADTVV